MSKATLYKAAVLLLLTAILISVFVFGWSDYVHYSSRRALHAVGRHARDITSIEVLRITSTSESGPEGSYSVAYGEDRYGITGRYRLTAEQASELLRVWKRLTFVLGAGAGCHDPGFVIRFNGRHRKIFECAICFQCENISYRPAPFSIDVAQMVPTKYDPKSGYDDLKAFLTKLE